MGGRLAERCELWITWPVQLGGQTETSIYVAIFVRAIIWAELWPNGNSAVALLLEQNYSGLKWKLRCYTWVLINTSALCIGYIWKSSNIRTGRGLLILFIQ